MFNVVVDGEDTCLELPTEKNGKVTGLPGTCAAPDFSWGES